MTRSRSLRLDRLWILDRPEGPALRRKRRKSERRGLRGELGRCGLGKVGETRALSVDRLPGSESAVPVSSPSRSRAPRLGRACVSRAAAPPIAAAATLVPLTVPNRGVPSSFVPGSAVGNGHAWSGELGLDAALGR